MPDPLLLALILPVAAVPVIVWLRHWPNLRELVSLATAAGLFVVVSGLVASVLDGARPVLVLATWMPGLTLRLALEPLGAIFAAIASLLWIVNTLYSIGYMRGNRERHQTRFYCYFAIAISATMGIALAGNLVTLFLFYEILTLSTYPLVTHKGDDKARQAGRVYLGVLLGTSVSLLLLAIIWTWSVAGTTDFRPGGILGDRLTPLATGILLFLYLYGIGKAALLPVHRWLPAAMVAPTPVSALLHAVAVVKAGVFSVVKIVLYVFGPATIAAVPAAQWLLYIAGASIVIASMVALRQDNLKRRLAWSTISQLSYVTMATLLLAPLSLVAAMLHIAVHAFGKITLFFAAGSIYTASHKTEVSQLDGIGRRMPWTMAAFTIGAISMIGLPPAAGFLSKWFLLQGAWSLQSWFVIAVLVISTLLNAGYFAPIVYRAWFRPCQDDSHGEAPLAIVVAVSLTALLTVALFIYPDIPLQLARQAIGALP